MSETWTALIGGFVGALVPTLFAYRSARMSTMASISVTRGQELLEQASVLVHGVWLRDIVLDGSTHEEPHILESDPLRHGAILVAHAGLYFDKALVEMLQGVVSRLAALEDEPPRAGPEVKYEQCLAMLAAATSRHKHWLRRDSVWTLF